MAPGHILLLLTTRKECHMPRQRSKITVRSQPEQPVAGAETLYQEALMRFGVIVMAAQPDTTPPRKTG